MRAMPEGRSAGTIWSTSGFAAPIAVSAPSRVRVLAFNLETNAGPRSSCVP